MDTGEQERESASQDTNLTPSGGPRPGNAEHPNAAPVRPSAPQRRYLERGLDQPGGNLPLFDRDGRAVPKKTIEACIAHGWAELWRRQQIKPDWLVCRLTAAGYGVLGRAAPVGEGG